MKNLENVLPINQDNLEERTTEVIRNLILDGELEPGTHMTETSLSEILGVSRSVIRTSFQKLKYERLLVHHPNKGMFVVELTAKDVWEIYTLRNQLEVLATKLVIENMTDNKKQVLKEILQKMEKAASSNDYEESHRLDWLFHQKLMELTEHERLQESYRLLEGQTKLFLNLTKGFHLNSSDIFELHEPIIQAILNQDEALASSLMVKHIINDGDNLVKLLNKKN